MEREDGIIVGDEQLKSYITDYYKGLFGPSEDNTISLQENLTDDIPQVSSAENDTLISPFSEQEIREAVFQMEHNKAPGPDGFPAEFYQVFWEVIKKDLLARFSDCYEEKLPLFCLNFGVISLIPKTNDAKKIQQYRLICVLNVSFKIFAKVGTNRINKVAQSVIQPSQTTLIPGRNIMEGVVILHETIHELHTKKT